MPRRAYPLLLAAALSGCSGWRWSSGRERDVRTEPGTPASMAKDYAVSSSPRPPRRRPQDYLPKEITPDQMRRVSYYSDLGPNTIDVSGYPAQQRHNYAVYARACSQCHSLSRSINVPVVSRGYWELYILGMRFNARFRAGAKLPKEEVKAILDFLDYDSQQRKVLRQSEFDDLIDELKRRFDLVVAARMKSLQEPSQPLILRSEQH